MRIPKVSLKQSFSHSKWVFHAVLSMTVLQALTALFFLTVPNFVVFFRLMDREFNEDSKSVLKQSFSRSKWVFQAVLSMTVLSNCFC